MKKIADSIIETIGHTPIVRLSAYDRVQETVAVIYAKIESFNPGGSVKDRVALNMILSAEKSGLLCKGGIIIEPTSGNTGIGLALVGAARGYKVILTMPETMSIERRKLVAAYGAEVVLTPGDKGMKGAIAEAERLQRSIPGSVILGQFVNPANPEAHYRTTGPEIWDAMDGKVDFFVAGVGTGGTVSGVGRYLKEHNPDVRIIAVEPKDSPEMGAAWTFTWNRRTLSINRPFCHSVTSPHISVLSLVHTAVGVSPRPKRYISFVMAASDVMS